MAELTQPWARPTPDVVEELGVSIDEGLTEAEVERRRQEYGPNRLREAEIRSAWDILVEQFKSLIVLLLVAAATLSFAFAGNYEAALALLRDTAATDRPATRQNLALIHGLAGDMAKAEKIARQDLSDDAVASNLKLYKRLRNLPSDKQAAVVLLGESAPKKTAKAQP
jgi:hypothetical protein